MNHGRCIACGHNGSTTRHHIVPRQNIVREYRKGPALAALLRDPRNLVPMHFGCHLAHENWAPRLKRSQIPAQAWEFARELGEWAVIVLERGYPDA